MNSLADAKIDYAKQLAALPWRLVDGGKIEFMMVTSRISKHWLVPKGWPISGKSAPGAALQEAFEEAGIKGKMGSKPLGKYNYLKVLKDGSSIPCVVKVYGMRVTEELADWPEKLQRERRWFAPHEAAGLVTEPGLAAFLASVKVPVGKSMKKSLKSHSEHKAA
jgi:8-oxo-dGTP pyrophosphatase MutT (NUDIX family)